MTLATLTPLARTDMAEAIRATDYLTAELRRAVSSGDLTLASQALVDLGTTAHAYAQAIDRHRLIEVLTESTRAWLATKPFEDDD